MSRRSRAELAGVILGDASPVAVMGVINVSPESFHAGSVYLGEEAVLRAALGMVEAGAAPIDVRARPSAPHLQTGIRQAQETERPPLPRRAPPPGPALALSGDPCVSPL